MTVEELARFVPIFTSVIAIFISLGTLVFNIWNYKKSLITQAITANRIEWITEVRNLISQFIEAYVTSSDKKEMIQISAKVQLYFRGNNKHYDAVTNAMQNCMKEPFDVNKQENLEELIQATLVITQRAWIRIKIEGGQTKRKDKKVRNQVDSYFNGIEGGEDISVNPSKTDKP